MMPFQVNFEPGTSLCKQVVYAVKKSLVAGQMRPGDLLEVHPGIGTVVAAPPPSSPAARGSLLKQDLEHLVVEAKKVGLALDDVTAAIAYHWAKLS